MKRKHPKDKTVDDPGEMEDNGKEGLLEVIEKLEKNISKKKSKGMSFEIASNEDTPNPGNLDLTDTGSIDKLYTKLWADLRERDRETDIKILLNCIFSILITLDPVKFNSPVYERLVESLKVADHPDTLPMIDQFLRTPRMGKSRY